MSDNRWDAVRKLVDRGAEGKPISIPVPYKRLRKDFDISRQMLYGVGGDTGTGKSAFTHFTFAIYPYLWWKTHKKETDIKLKIFIRAMERPFELTALKWACIRMFTKYNVIVDPFQAMGKRENNLTSEERQKLKECIAFFEEAEDIVEIIPGQINPEGIRRQLKAHADANGQTIQDTEYRSHYVPNDPNLITICIVDHIGKVKRERVKNPDGSYSNLLSEKETIDRMSTHLMTARDKWGFSGVVVQQFNRSINDQARRRDLTPELSDFYGSSGTQQDADLVLGLFEPSRYRIGSWMDYDIGKMTDKFTKFNRFRGLSILKNSYGGSGIHAGLRFVGECGYFNQLPTPTAMSDAHYNAQANLPNFRRM